MSPHLQEFSQLLKKCRIEFLTQAASKTMDAGEFTLDLAIQVFELQHKVGKTLWKIEDIVETKGFSPTALESILAKYSRTVDRSNEAACRIPIDLVLIESLSILINCEDFGSETPSDNRPRTPGPYEDIKMCREVSFSHDFSPMPVGKAATAIDHATTVNGRVDCAIGIITGSRRRIPNRRFHSLLLVVEAKSKDNARTALPQLVVYLACLRQERNARGRSNCSVYGVASDGFFFIFVMITHEGKLMISRSFDIMEGELATVLGCLVCLLRKTLEMSTTATKAEGQVDETEAIGDYALDIYNKFMDPPATVEDD